MNPEPGEERLLPLRKDLGLHPAPPAPDGSPQWTIADPLTHTFYRIGWSEFALLSRWQAGESPAALCATPSRGRYWPSGKAAPAVPLDGLTSCAAGLAPV